jgi:hypothetical protein
VSLKHVIVERIKPGNEAKFEALGVELKLVMLQHDDWVQYRAWRGTADVDVGDPPLIDVGILNRATAYDGFALFDGDYPSREAFERQLQAMRNDADVVRILVRIAELADRAHSRSYVLDSWTPPLPE